MLVLARRYGQLGNRLFLYAHLIAAARHYGVELLNPCFAEYADLFPQTRNDLLCRYNEHLGKSCDATGKPQQCPSPIARKTLMLGVESFTKTLHRVGLRHHPYEIIRLKSGESCDLAGDRFRRAVESGRTVLLQGWLFRSGTLLNEHWPHIRKHFGVDQADRSAIDSTLEQARHSSDLVVGVHIRRGDYAQFQGGRFFYSDDVYATWMKSIQRQAAGKRVRFLVCTNEPLDASKYAGIDLVAGPGTAIRDMYSLAETDLIIGPPSTFTAWAAMVGQTPRIELNSAADVIELPDLASRTPVAA